MANEDLPRDGVATVDGSEDEPAIVDDAQQGGDAHVGAVPVAKVPWEIAGKSLSGALDRQRDALCKQREKAARFGLDGV